MPEGIDPWYVLNFDGAANSRECRGGAVLACPDGRVLRFSRAGGRTNNEAEYLGLICGLEGVLKAVGKVKLRVRGDSALVINQLLGHYQVRAANLRKYHQAARALIALFPQLRLEWVPRGRNGAANDAAGGMGSRPAGGRR